MHANSDHSLFRSLVCDNYKKEKYIMIKVIKHISINKKLVIFSKIGLLSLIKYCDIIKLDGMITITNNLRSQSLLLNDHKRLRHKNKTCGLQSRLLVTNHIFNRSRSKSQITLRLQSQTILLIIGHKLYN